MTGADPMQAVWDALDAAGCRPRGAVHRFRASCPSHADQSPSLDVREGVDGKVLLLCRSGCATDAVLAALGLGWRDLFPPGHRHGRSAKLPDVAAIAGVRLLGAGRDLARVLVALEAVGPAGPYPSAFPVRFAAPRAPGCA